MQLNSSPPAGAKTTAEPSVAGLRWKRKKELTDMELSLSAEAEWSLLLLTLFAYYFIVGSRGESVDGGIEQGKAAEDAEGANCRDL